MRANEEMLGLVKELRKIRLLMEKMIGDERLLSGRIDKLEAVRRCEREVAPRNHKEKEPGKGQPKG